TEVAVDAHAPQRKKNCAPAGRDEADATSGRVCRIKSRWSGATALQSEGQWWRKTSSPNSETSREHRQSRAETTVDNRSPPARIARNAAQSTPPRNFDNG